MRRARIPASRMLPGLLLGALLFMGIGTAQVATAQQPMFNSDRPVSSLKQAAPITASDSKLTALAIALQKARADTEISYDTYRDGVEVFRKHHPGFYGNFFGDPFYATYDARYMRLTRERQFAEPDINPQNSFQNSDWFFCAPFTYDPAFNGRCRGFKFAVSDFFFLPSGPAFGRQDLASNGYSARTLATRKDVSSRSRSAGSVPHTPDTLRAPAADIPAMDRSESGPPASDAGESVSTDTEHLSAHAARIRTPDRLAPQIEVPDDLDASMQETVSLLKQRETVLRIRQAIDRQRERGSLSARDRARVAHRIAEERGMDELARSISRVQGPRTDRAARQSPERIDREELQRRVRQRAAERSSTPSSSGSVQQQSPDAASSESLRRRSRSSEDSSGNRQLRDKESSSS